MPDFVPGRELAGAFYREVVAPLAAGVPHAAALAGYGSDVLGFDDARSTDHGWGPRVHVFVEPGAIAALVQRLERELPEEFRGWPVRYGWDEVPVSHHVAVVVLEEWVESQLGCDPRRGLTARAWLSMPQQALLEVTAGPLFHDGPGELSRVRAALAWYPDDVWLWLLACEWRRIDQEEPFVGRAAEAGDELGSRLLAARLVRDVVRLCFLLEREYAPYSKWFGSAFARLDAAREIGPALHDALAAPDYPAREAALGAALESAARRHNALGVTRAVEPTARLFHERPFRVLGAGRFVDACLERVSDPWLRSLPLVGAIDQFVDSTDVLSGMSVFRRVDRLYESWASGE